MHANTCQYLRKYMQIHVNICVNTFKYVQIHANRANMCYKKTCPRYWTCAGEKSDKMRKM